MRWTWLPALIFIASAAASGCKREERVTSEAQGPATSAKTAPVSLSQEELAAFVSTASDAGIEDFAGFSADERRFAWSAYSRGAGAHVLTVIPVEGEGSTKWLLNEEQLPGARAALADGGFTSARRTPAPDAGSVRVELQGHTVRLQYVGPRSTHTFYEDQPFGEGGFGVPQHAAFWGLSPSGRLGVLETVSASHAEFGSAKSFVFVPIRVEEGSR